MHQHRIIRRIEHYALDSEDGLDRDDDGWVLVRRNQDPDVSDTVLFDEFTEFFGVLRIDEGAAIRQRKSVFRA